MSDFARTADQRYQALVDSTGLIPGLSIAVVEKERVVYQNAFGMADRESDQPATRETLYYIASSTKSMTALAALLLAEQGKLDLDAPLTQYLPEVRFAPELKAERITIRNLLNHTSGLDNDALVFRTAFSGEHTPEILLRVLNTTKSNKAGFGNYQYTNVGYNILSIIMDKTLGQPWQQVLDEMIFQPAGMTHTTAYMSLAKEKGWPVAQPYSLLLDSQRLYLTKNDGMMHAAGGLISTSGDLARWLILQVNQGRLEGRQIFTEKLIRDSHRLQAAGESQYGNIQRFGYGWGWVLGTLDGDTLIHHFGGFAGYHAHVSFMPQHHLGVVVLVNDGAMGGRLAGLAASLAYDWWRGKPEAVSGFDQNMARLIGSVPAIKERIAADLLKRSQRPWQLTLPPADYLGTYDCPEIGQMTVSMGEKNLAVRIGGLYAESTPFTTGNSIRVELVPQSGEVIVFQVEDGKVVGATYHDYEFQRVAGLPKK